mmetsp:Transcript_12218/g.38735  ORF Transcript_12218/g.38735 Transcript_12218/m.38735 type:complete len:208 (-) Transcript_12218:638-1261(-)
MLKSGSWSNRYAARLAATGEAAARSRFTAVRRYSSNLSGLHWASRLARNDGNLHSVAMTVPSVVAPSSLAAVCDPDSSEVNHRRRTPGHTGCLPSSWKHTDSSRPPSGVKRRRSSRSALLKRMTRLDSASLTSLSSGGGRAAAAHWPVRYSHIKYRTTSSCEYGWPSRLSVRTRMPSGDTNGTASDLVTSSSKATEAPDDPRPLPPA